MRRRLLNDSHHGIRRALHLTSRRTAYLLLFAAILIVLPFNVAADYEPVKPENLVAKFGSSVTFNETTNVYTINATEGNGVEVLFRLQGDQPLTFNIKDDSRQNSLVFVRSTADSARRCVLEIVCDTPHEPSPAPAKDHCDVHLWNSSHHRHIKTSNTSFSVSVTTTNIAVSDVYGEESYGATCHLRPEHNTNPDVWNLVFYTEKDADGTHYTPLPIHVDNSTAQIVEQVQSRWPTTENILYIVSPPFFPPAVFLTYVGLTALLLLTLAAINIWAIYRHCVKMRLEDKRNRIVEILEHDKDEVGKETKEYTIRRDTEMGDEEKSRKDQVTKREDSRKSTALPPHLRTEATRDSMALQARESVSMNVQQ